MINLKIEGYAKELADFLALFADYSANSKKIPKQTNLTAELTLDEKFPSDKKYSPNCDEGYPPIYSDAAH